MHHAVTRAVALGLMAGLVLPAASHAQEQDTLTVAWPAVYSYIGDPAQNGGRQGERLVWLGVNEPALYIAHDGTIVPRVAESWEVSEDGLVHTLRLRRAAGSTKSSCAWSMP